jgi:hypothetical protein
VKSTAIVRVTQLWGAEAGRLMQAKQEELAMAAVQKELRARACVQERVPLTSTLLLR